MAAQQNAAEQNAAQQRLLGALENSETVQPDDDIVLAKANLWFSVSGGIKNVYLLFSKMYRDYKECMQLNKIYKEWLTQNNISLETGISNLQGGKRKSKRKKRTKKKALRRKRKRTRRKR